MFSSKKLFSRFLCFIVFAKRAPNSPVPVSPVFDENSLYGICTLAQEMNAGLLHDLFEKLHQKDAHTPA